MRRIGFSLALLVAPVVGLASCSRPMDMAVTGQSLQRPVFAVVELGERRPKRLCVDAITVSAVDRRGEDTVMWEIASTDEGCVWLKAVTYGQTPPGFEVRRAATPLREGETYEGHAHGWTRGLASVPWMAGARFAFRSGVWNVTVR